ncbi:winged helix-turn-helix domain-containing protein [Parvularcula marina]|uniref:winged helix-turn-helix domain-containing protein n=1 Tax=Parvularcula marina TaxID=2292771 RepID=UPI0018F49CB6|nr:winged helix-turn-helix domain-containing protein [Parvularcula marina]
MIHSFGIFELDIDAVELRREGAAVPIEPQVFALIVLLVENRHRMVSKDEIIETIWNGRIVSESAITSRIKSARKALGDDGKAQKLIRTVHGMGFRFVGELDPPAVKAEITAEPEIEPAPVETPSAKPSIAVLPFRQIGVMGPYAGISDAIPYELISSLSRLRWLKVIARGSSFRLRSADPDLAEIGGYSASAIASLARSKFRDRTSPSPSIWRRPKAALPSGVSGMTPGSKMFTPLEKKSAHVSLRPSKSRFPQMKHRPRGSNLLTALMRGRPIIWGSKIFIGSPKSTTPEHLTCLSGRSFSNQISHGPMRDSHPRISRMPSCAMCPTVGNPRFLHANMPSRGSNMTRSIRLRISRWAGPTGSRIMSLAV